MKILEEDEYTSYQFNTTGEARKALVYAAGEILGVKPQYLRAPSYAYQVGCFHIDKDGTLTAVQGTEAAAIERLLDQLAMKGFEYEPRQAEVIESDVHASTTLELETDAPEAAAPSSAPSTLEVSLPLKGFTDTALTNLERLVASKATLIKKALGVDALPIVREGDRLTFPWFAQDSGDVAVRAYTHFVTALCETAKKQKRVTATERDVPNEKFAFRCYLLKLGFIGRAYRDERALLLRNLTGNSAFRTGQRKGVE